MAQFPYPFTISSKRYLDDARDADAREVAKLCSSIVGNLNVRRSDGSIVTAEPGDIALLAPTSTDLWRYERALEEKGLPVASQAGKNLYRRQEAQDFVALVRAIADNRDTLALGAVLRGPIIGLTDHELLDIAEALERDGFGKLTIQTDPRNIAHPLGRQAIEILQDLWRRRRGTSPHALLSEAFERLRVIASVCARFADQRARAVGNLGNLMERARGYDVLGLKQLAIDLGTEWGEAELFDEAPADHRGDAIEIVTIHKAKGLEWPVVIPINLVAMPSRSDEFFFRPGKGIDPGTVHWTFGEIASSTLAQVVADDAVEAAEERERQLYVACTRAIDYLIIPAPSQSPEESWLKFFDLDLGSLPFFLLPAAGSALPVASTPPAVAQSAGDFADEARRIASLPRIAWRRPSEADPDRALLERAIIEAAAVEDPPDAQGPVIAGAGPLRRTVLHAMMGELLVGTIAPELEALAQRASSLMEQISFGDLPRPSAGDLARVARATFNHEKLAAYRDHLVPEFPLYGVQAEGALVSARADAVAIVDGVAAAAFDWKSDANPLPKTRIDYRAQLLEYLSLSGAPRGAVIYMCLDHIEFDFVALDPQDRAPDDGVTARRRAGTSKEAPHAEENTGLDASRRAASRAGGTGSTSWC